MHRGLSRHALVVTTSVCLIASTLTGVALLTATAKPAAGATAQQQPGDLSRPDVVSAQVTARATRRKVLVTGLSSPVSSTWANPDGTITMDESSEPVQGQDADGNWRPVDETLLRQPNGTLVPTITAVGTSFGGAGTTSVTRLSSTAGPTGLDWLANLPAPTLAGATATYPNVLPGTDLTATATSTGFELSLVVKARPTGGLPATVGLPLKGAGLSWTLSSGGLLTGTDPAGRVVVTSAGAAVYDATTDPRSGIHPHSAPLALALTGKAGAQKLVVTVPTAFLNDPSTVYPVTIDPSTSWAKSAWAYVDAAAPTTVFYNTSATGRVGAWDTAGTHRTRSFYTFTTTGLTGKHLLSATFKINESSAQDCTARPFEVWSTTPLTSTMNYNTQPSWGTLYATITSNAGGGTSCPAADVSGDVTTWAQHVLTGGYTSATLGIKVNTSFEATQAYFKQFGVVTISLTYNSYPSSVSQLTVSPCAAGCPATGTRYVGSSRPTFSSYATDADNSQIAHYFAIRTAANPGVDLLSGHSTAAGNGSISWQVPAANALPDGDYLYYAWAFDGADVGPTTGPIAFTVDATAPAGPTISSSGQPAGALTTSSDFSFTLSPNSSDTTAYAYKLETGIYSAWISGTSATIHNVTKDALHTLYVIAQDRAGNVSAPSTYSFGGGLTSPADQDRTQRYLTLSAAAPSAYPYVGYQWRKGTTASWTSIPSGDVTLTGGGTPTSWPVSPIATSYVWNLANSMTGTDGLAEVRACLYTTPTDPSPVCLNPNDVTLAANSFGDSQATSQVGPGTLSLLTGDFQVSATDVSVPSFNGTLTVGRSLTTLPTPTETAGPLGVFGPGWSASLPGTDAGAGDTRLDDETSNGYIDILDSDGSSTSYEATSALTSYPISFAGVGDAAATGAVLQKTNASTIVLTDADGTKTTWVSTSNGWLASTVQEPGSQSATSYTRDSAGRVTRILAPVPSGITCTSPDTTAGCRSLTLAYTTMVAGGVTVTRLQTVTLVAYDPQASAMASVIVASYDYDSNGRLSTITPPGLAAWTLNYDSGHRLASVTRPDGSATATNTISYGVPVSGSGAPVDLSATTAAGWGQTSDLPLTATAVFGPNHVPAGAPTSSDWPYAAIGYLDVDGRQVNSAQYGAGQWLVDTTRYDSHGNDVWSLTADNRAQALSPTSATDPAAAAATTTAATAELLATTNVYTADGSELLDSYGPIHPIQLANGSLIDGRSHTHTDYDQGAPATGGPYQLATTVTNTVQDTSGANYDARIIRTGYDPINTGDASGWDLKQATSTTVQMGSSPSSADLVRITRYNSAGQVIGSRLPSSNGADAATTVTSYYVPGSSGTCVSNALAGLACTVGPAAQPSTGNPLPVKTFSYNRYNQSLTVTETAGSTVRTTTTDYDSAGRPISNSITVTPTAAGGTALPTTTASYDSATGLPTTLAAGGQTLTTGYDSLGRVTSYTDAGGNIATTGYDLSGRATSVSDGKGTTSYSYDSSTEHRGLVTSEDLGVSPALSTLTVGYDPTGNANSVTYPNGLVATTGHDNAGGSTSLDYAMAGTSWLHFTRTPGSDGNTATQTSPGSSQQFGYDNDGRLASTQDTVLDSLLGTSCTTRVYGSDRNSNRTGLTSYPDDGSDPINGHCNTAGTPTTWTGSYDQADRLTNTGYSYDTLGRTTGVPAADVVGIGSHAGTTGALSIGYYSNDLVASQAQGGRTLGFTLDPLQNRIVSTTDTAAATSTNHYADSSDSPAWTSSGTNWTRDLVGVGGGLVATVDQAGTVTLQLTNLHGDLVATAADSSSATGITAYGEFTEYGAPRTPSTAPDNYGWLGTKQRSTNDLAGLTLMGVRLYNSATGRFLSVDPVPGGTDDAYTYPSNPVDLVDDSGMMTAGDGGGSEQCVCNSSNRRYRPIGGSWYGERSGWMHVFVGTAAWQNMIRWAQGLYTRGKFYVNKIWRQTRAEYRLYRACVNGRWDYALIMVHAQARYRLNMRYAIWFTETYTTSWTTTW
jgi:RHS repeat-associated protein